MQRCAWLEVRALRRQARLAFGQNNPGEMRAYHRRLVLSAFAAVIQNDHVFGLGKEQPAFDQDADADRDGGEPRARDQEEAWRNHRLKSGFFTDD